MPTSGVLVSRCESVPLGISVQENAWHREAPFFVSPLCLTFNAAQNCSDSLLCCSTFSLLVIFFYEELFL